MVIYISNLQKPGVVLNELGINVDLNSTNVKDLDFTKGEGLLHIEGTTNLNYNAVRLIAILIWHLEKEKDI